MAPLLLCYEFAMQFLILTLGVPLPGEVKFLKEGAPEETAGPFHDDRYDDESLEEVSKWTGERK